MCVHVRIYIHAHMLDMYKCAIMNKIVYLIPARALVTPLTRVASLDTPPLSLSLAVGCAHWFPPSVGQHHFTPTGSLCGPGDRPNPPRPRSHQVTHIVRFATHPAQKSISELVRAPKRYFRPLKQLNYSYNIISVWLWCYFQMPSQPNCRNENEKAQLIINEC